MTDKEKQGYEVTATYIFAILNSLAGKCNVDMTCEVENTIS